jgi:hypothetical protein
MAEKLTDRIEKTSNFADADVFHLVDVSDTSQDPAGSSFKVKLVTLWNYFLTLIGGSPNQILYKNGSGVITGDGNATRTAAGTLIKNEVVANGTSAAIGLTDGGLALINAIGGATGDYYNTISPHVGLASKSAIIKGASFDETIYNLILVNKNSIEINGSNGGGYSFILPRTTPTANQILKANATTPAQLEWADGDSIEGFIPLSGTTTGNPVTGDIEFEDPFIGSTRRIYVPFNGGEKEIAFPDDASITLTVNDVDNGVVGVMSLGTIGLTISSNEPSSAGITGGADFSPNITDLDYTQKIYVDTIAPSIQLETPSTGGTVTATAGKKNHTVMVDTVLLAALTINLPATPVDGQICRFVSVGGITALTLAAPGGASIVGTITTLVALVGTTFQYNTSNTTWYRSV